MRYQGSNTRLSPVCSTSDMKWLEAPLRLSLFVRPAGASVSDALPEI
jgi:hypothetical protein